MTFLSIKSFTMLSVWGLYQSGMRCTTTAWWGVASLSALMCICPSGVRMGMGDSESLSVSGYLSRSFCLIEAKDVIAQTVWCGKLAGMILGRLRSSHPTSKSSWRSLLITASTLQKRPLAHRVTVAVPSTCMGSPDAFTSDGRFSLFINKFGCCVIRYASRDTCIRCSLHTRGWPAHLR